MKLTNARAHLMEALADTKERDVKKDIVDIVFDEFVREGVAEMVEEKTQGNRADRRKQAAMERRERVVNNEKLSYGP